MTDEQIKQNAIKAAADFKDWHHPQMSFYEGYIEGAHSRDEEIKKLQIELMKQEEYIKDYKEELELLKNQLCIK